MRLSEVCNTLTLLDNVHDYQAYFRQLSTESSTQLVILTGKPDPLIFNNADIIEAISAVVRSHSKASVRVLIKDIRHIAKQPLQLVELSKRLSSKIMIRQLTVDRNSRYTAFAIGDRRQILVKHDEDNYQGFYNSSARAEARNLLEEFDDLWERQSADIPDLMTLRL